MSLHKRQPPDAAEIRRIKGQADAGVPWKWIAGIHELSEETCRRLVAELNSKEKRN